MCVTIHIIYETLTKFFRYLSFLDLHGQIKTDLEMECILCLWNASVQIISYATENI